MGTPPETLVTERLLLRLPVISDAEMIVEYSGDPEVTRFMDWSGHRSVEDAVRHLRECESRWVSGAEFCWVIAIHGAQSAIGRIACRVRTPDAELGYVLTRRHWGHGFATEAVCAVVNWALSAEDIDRVWATCDIENVASVRVLEKAGLAREAILRDWSVRPNISPAPRDAYLYSRRKR